jgi:DNA integrity scanning protein DisA with diadenylate cyclase activity
VEGDNGTTVNLVNLGGTRHQSAAHFANAQPGAVAIVVSQDGHVSFISSDPQTHALIVIQLAELAVIPEGLGAALWSYSLFAEMDLL